MRVSKISDITGKLNTMDLPTDDFTLEEFRLGYLGHVQDAFPHMTADQREFLLTGITPEEWKEYIGEEPEDEWTEEDEADFFAEHTDEYPF